ncbi:MAG: 3-methyl-2-oxobutanoate hydroxymethyltransferase [Actinomycetales bacterium]|nr:3-methyl-2-oxobutanoate hydroxymethyltransferase [Actinomycetales bacterium]
MSQPAPNSLYGGSQNRRITTADLTAAKSRGEKWPMITCYDANTANIFDETGFPVLLVGDSAAMVVYGFSSTLPVTTSMLLPLVAAVERSSKRALILADLPFGSYQESPAQALATATRFMKEGNAHAVKLEGGANIAPTVQVLTEAGIPVFGHIGLTPQSVNQLGGYRVQGRGDQAQKLIEDAIALQDAGASAIVLEVVPADLAAKITELLSIPTVGIGAGNGTDAQVIVWQDLLGLSAGPLPKFVQPYADLRQEIRNASSNWAAAVVSGEYPDEAHSYT